MSGRARPADDPPRGAPRGPARRAPHPAPRPQDDAIDFRAIVESAADVIYTLDLDGRLTFVNERGFELLGYDRGEGEAFIGANFMEVLAAGATGAAVEAIRKRTEAPHLSHVFRLEVRHKTGAPVLLEIHGGPLRRDGRIVGRIGLGRVLDPADRADGATARSVSAQALQAERMRIGRGLRDAIAQVVFGGTAAPEAREALLADVRRATAADIARRLRLDDVDLDILRQIAAGASNREIGAGVHLSPAAVKDRVRRLMERLGARRRTELAAHALRLGIA